MWYHGGIHALFSTPTHPSVLPPAYPGTCISSHPPDHPPAHQHSPTQVVDGLLYFRRSVLPSAQPAGCPSANLFAYSPAVHPFVHLFIRPLTRPAARPPTYLPTHQLPACPSVCSFIRPPIRPPARSPTYLPTHQPSTHCRTWFPSLKSFLTMYVCFISSYLRRVTCRQWRVCACSVGRGLSVRVRPSGRFAFTT